MGLEPTDAGVLRGRLWVGEERELIAVRRLLRHNADHGVTRHRGRPRSTHPVVAHTCEQEVRNAL